MEFSDKIAKSVLKKSKSLCLNNKKVSFSNTVKLYIDDPNKNSSNYEDIISPMKWVEISIVDKSHDTSIIDPSFEDCEVSDFLVHKVIYGSDVLNDEDNEIDHPSEDIDHECVVFESPKDEDLEFVVHKVTDHEDVLIEKELELENHVSAETLDKSDSHNESKIELTENITKGLSELSVKNILEHDKIIAFIDQRSLNFPSLQNTLRILEDNKPSKCKTNSFINSLSGKDVNRLGLSPPLQELSLDKIVKAHSDNILEAIDISPLNSVQETDSDSDLSSEGTMIMMTTEECEKNEQHIRESLLKYQALKEKEAKSAQCEQSVDIFDENLKISEEPCDVNINSKPECLEFCSKSDSPPENSVIPVSDSNFFNNVESSFQSSCLENCSFDSVTEPPPPKDCRSFSLSDIELLHSMCENSFQNNSNRSKKNSLDCNNFWDSSLTSVEIPKDVREWKILLNSFEKRINRKLEYNEDHETQSDELSVNKKLVFSEESDSSDYHGSTSQIDTFSYDELESFVNENTERVERIRRRYLTKHEEVNKHVFQHSPRGKERPRFGSTAQILHLMQKQNNPPFYTYSGTKNHMSWPCDDVASDPEHEKNLKHRHSPHMYACQSSSSDCSSHSSFDSDEHLNFGGDQISISSSSSLLLQERGRPEGASPPKPSVEDCFEQSYEVGPDGFVYFSMKV